MSRSYKKVPIVKDPSNSRGKKIGSRKFRRKTKNKLQNHIINEDTMLPEDKSEVINDYDVVDYRTVIDTEGNVSGFNSLKSLKKGKKKKLSK